MTDDRTRPAPDDERTLSISDVNADEEATLDGDPSGPVVDDPQMPDSIGGFRIIGKLGEGGMGTVWEADRAALARDTRTTGRMLADAQTMVSFAPHLALIPGMAIILTVLGLNLMGDGLRDYLDPRLRVVRT